ncbi:M16 family metallopeptidase [Helicobacter typhlonius]|uniref:M16 family metallopeptidase n=2 Tax=Helicobacter typhlonius TaxID=76936 RepID=UPI002FE0E319
MKYIYAFLMIFTICIGGCMSKEKEADIQKQGQKSNVSSAVDSIHINGVKVPFIFEGSANLPVGSLQLVFMGGSADSDIPGLASMSAKILNEGTKALGNVGFANELESKAIDLYASAGFQTLSFNISYLKEFEDESLRLFAMLLKDPNLTQSSLNKLKDLTLSKLARDESDFDEVASKNLNKILFKGTPLAIPVIGERESIESMTLKDIEAFLARNLVLNRLIIVAGGDMQEAEIKSKLGTLLESLPKGEAKQRLHFKVSKEIDSIIEKKPTEQAFIYFGAPFDVADKEKNYIAKVMSFILGGSGFGSRIMEEVRVKRGLAYSASLSISVGGIADYASGHLQTKLENKDEAIQVVKEVLNDFITNGATQEELDAAKAFLQGSEPLREERLSQRLNVAFMNYFKGLPLDYHKQELQRINNLSLEELNSYIKSHKEILQMSFSIVE